ncbi:MAG TPA: hypothetical protein VE913_10720 [Longimicrobium sp.]|nr:hypothetical protein [Longimicrobium sp.]
MNMGRAGVTAYTERTQDLLLVPLAVGSTVRLNNIFFDLNRATLQPSGRMAFAVVVPRAADSVSPVTDVTVEGLPSAFGGRADAAQDREVGYSGPGTRLLSWCECPARMLFSRLDPRGAVAGLPHVMIGCLHPRVEASCVHAVTPH